MYNLQKTRIKKKLFSKEFKGGFFTLIASETEPDYQNEFKEVYGLDIEDKWERVKIIFKRDGMGNLHPEFYNALHLMQTAFLGGFTFGAITHHQSSIAYYLRYNDATVYCNKKSAQRHLSNFATLGAVKGALKIGSRIAMYAGAFSIISSCIMAYRNKNGILEYVESGCVLGVLHKFQFGWRGMFIGGLMGITVGTLYGITMWCSMKLLGVEIPQIKYAQFLITQKNISKENSTFKTWSQMEKTHLKYKNTLESFTNTTEQNTIDISTKPIIEDSK